jgi:hypothetical protein
MTFLFRWTGEYVGFFLDGWLFDRNGRYLGWLDADGRVWKADGNYLGELVEGCHVLRNSLRSPPVRRTPRVPPVPAAPPTPPTPRVPRVPRPGWSDALAQLGRLPTADDLVGTWDEQGKRLGLTADGRYSWTAPGEPVVAGTWELRGELLRAKADGDGESARPVGYRILEYTGDSLLLRWITQEHRSLPFRLRRVRVDDPRTRG